MRIWFEREGMLGTKKPRFFAVVEEEMIDKNGRTVAPAAKPAEPTEPVTAEQTPVETTVVVAAPEAVGSERLDDIEKRIIEVDQKVDSIIEELKKAQETEVAEETPAEEPAEEVAEETPTEEPAEEVVEETPTEEPAEEVVEETPTEEPAEEVVEETPTEEPAEEVAEETPAEEPAEEVVEETPAEEPAEEVVEETPTEEPVETMPEDVADEAAATSAVAVAIDMANEAEGVGDAEKKGYVRSPNFAEKMMAASEVIQDRYDELKNYALRFRKLKSRISKKFDSINMGRFHFVKLSVAGKTLKLYLNMDISTVDPKFRCVDMSGKKTYVTVPVMLRIKSGRAMKYAKRLIDQCAEQNGMLERRKPFEVDAIQLIEEALKNNNDVENENEIDVVDVEETSEE